MHLPATAPVPTLAPSPAPLELRQDNSGFHVITQTIVRGGTTITTLVTLGNSGPTPSPDPSPSPAPSPTPVPTDDHHGLSSADVGAILGSVIGFIVVLIIIGFCVYNSRGMPVAYETEKRGSGSSSRTRYRYVEEDVYTSTTGRRTKPPPPTVPPPVRKPPAAVVSEKIPGGPKFPTYRAIPIANPRNPPYMRRTG